MICLTKVPAHFQQAPTGLYAVALEMTPGFVFPPGPLHQSRSSSRGIFGVWGIRGEGEHGNLIETVIETDRLPRWPHGKESVYNAGDVGSIPGSGRSPGKGNGNPFQYSCLGNPMDRRAYGPWGRKRVRYNLMNKQ